MSGIEWVVEAHGCEASTLVELAKLRHLFEALIEGLALHPVGVANWHQFPGAGGITGLQLLQESHLACHTFPEFGSLCLNVFCCRPRPQADFDSLLKQDFGATSVQVRQIERPYQA
jgi:S-adenosylmethionine decarboxylase